jgi:hypothetical protein
VEGKNFDRRRRAMELQKSRIQWENSCEKALERAKKETKPVLLDFFKEG